MLWDGKDSVGNVKSQTQQIEEDITWFPASSSNREVLEALKHNSSCASASSDHKDIQAFIIIGLLA